MSVAVLILAAGEQKRWPMTEPPYYKQLLDVGGETIIARIWRQCRARGREPVAVTHNQELVQILSFRPECHRWTVETLFCTHELWQERTIVLLGDVIYSRATMDRIFALQNEELRVFGNQFEIYALSMQFKRYPLATGGSLLSIASITDNLADAISHAESGVARGGGKLRKFYQAYCGLNMTGNERESKVLRWVDDYTQDVDNPGDYTALLDKVARGIIDDLPEVKG